MRRLRVIRFCWRAGGARLAAHYTVLLIPAISRYHRRHRLPGLCFDWRPM